MTSLSSIRAGHRAAFLWVVAGLALVAASISGYLLFLSIAERKAAGCGDGSGCDQVLGSAWSHVGNIPVAAPAVLLYVGIAVAAGWTRFAWLPRRKRLAWSMLVGLSLVAAVAGLWFTYLQIARVHAFCPWCLSVHALGLLILLLVGWILPRLSTDSSANGAPGPSRLALAGGAALLCVGALAASQLLFPPPVLPARVYRTTLPAGTLELTLSDVPTLGATGAPHVVTVLVDYSCPHCRSLHRSLDRALTKYPNDLCIAIVVVPINNTCNPHLKLPAPERHRYACDLAKLSLAVFRASPKAFAAYDHILFDPEIPLEPVEARQRAAELVGAEALRRAEADPWVAERLAKNMEVFAATGAGPVPVLILPGEMATRMPEDPNWATRFLEEKLKLSK